MKAKAWLIVMGPDTTHPHYLIVHQWPTVPRLWWLKLSRNHTELEKKSLSNIVSGVNPSWCDSARPLVNHAVPGNGTVTLVGSWLSTSLNCEDFHQASFGLGQLFPKQLLGMVWELEYIWTKQLSGPSFTIDRIYLDVKLLCWKVIENLSPYPNTIKSTY